jgi:hypothetical protein
MSKTRKNIETIEIMTAENTAENTQQTAETATAQQTAETKKDSKNDSKNDSKKQKARTVAEIKKALESGENATLAEIAKLFRDMKLQYKEAICEADKSLYILRDKKVYISFNFSKKQVTAFSRKESRELEIFDSHVANNEKRKKAVMSYKDFYKLLTTLTA